MSDQFEIKARAEAEQLQTTAGKDKGVMVIITAFGGLVLLAVVFAALRNAAASRHNNSHIA